MQDHSTACTSALSLRTCLFSLRVYFCVLPSLCKVLFQRGTSFGRATAATFILSHCVAQDGNLSSHYQRIIPWTATMAVYVSQLPLLQHGLLCWFIQQARWKADVTGAARWVGKWQIGVSMENKYREQQRVEMERTEEERRLLFKYEEYNKTKNNYVYYRSV